MDPEQVWPEFLYLNFPGGVGHDARWWARQSSLNPDEGELDLTEETDPAEASESTLWWSQQ